MACLPGLAIGVAASGPEHPNISVAKQIPGKPPAAPRRGRDLLRRGEEPARGIGLTRLRGRREAIRRKVFGRTKQEVRERLQALHQEMDAGVRSPKTYTVRQAVDDWLREGLDGCLRADAQLYEGRLGPLLEVIGARPLRLPSAGDVRTGTKGLRSSLKIYSRLGRHHAPGRLAERAVERDCDRPRTFPPDKRGVPGEGLDG
jgi:hypothetical protein